MSGGVRSYKFARSLVERGHEVHVITTRRGPSNEGDVSTDKWEESIEDGIHVHWAKVQYSNHMGFYSRVRAFLAFAWMSAFKIISLRGDLVFATSTPLTIAIPGILGSKCLGIPMVFEVRDLWPETPIAMGILKNPIAIALARALEKLAYSFSRTVIALSPGMQAGVVGRGKAIEDTVVIPNCADTSLFAYNEVRDRQFRDMTSWLGTRPLVLYTGTFGFVNGLSYLVRLAQLMQSVDPEVRFLAIGDGAERHKVVELARSTGTFETNLFFMNSVPKKDLPVYLAAASMVASYVIDVPELWHNSANKFFDGLAAGRPILINHGGWQADIITREQIGLVLSPSCRQEDAVALSALLRDQGKLCAMGEKSRTVAHRDFEIDDLAHKFCDVIEAAVLPRQN
jgi:glycosyltransferase involved in cell wall biosynthesis